MTNAIEIQGLVKHFGRTVALDHLDLQVEEGSVHGFLGPNGAGKSTTLRIILGLYRPDAGSVTVLGQDPVKSASAINKRIGYVPGDVALWPSMTGRQTLETLAGLRGARDQVREKELIDRFGLDPSKKCRDYSKGNRQKVALISAFSAPVDLLLLDEPTSGLDPLMEQVFRECVRDAATNGQSILLSSHILSEVEQLCSRVTIVRNGALVETGALAEMRHLAASRVTASFAQGLPAPVREVLTAHGLSAGAGSVLDLAVPHDALTPILGVITQNGGDNITCTPASLEDLFLRHYRMTA